MVRSDGYLSGMFLRTVRRMMSALSVAVPLLPSTTEKYLNQIAVMFVIIAVMTIHLQFMMHPNFDRY